MFELKLIQECTKLYEVICLRKRRKKNMKMHTLRKEKRRKICEIVRRNNAVIILG